MRERLGSSNTAAAGRLGRLGRRALRRALGDPGTVRARLGWPFAGRCCASCAEPARTASLEAVRISSQILDQLVAHARDDAPNECCGMIAAADGELTDYFRAANEFASPMRFQIDSRDQIRITNEIEAPGRGDRSDLPLASQQRGPALADRRQPRPLVARRALGDLLAGRRRAGRARLRDRRRRGRGGRARCRMSRMPVPSSRSPAPPARASTRSPSASAPTARCRSSTSAATSEEPITEAHERARKVKPQYTGGELVKAAFARNLAEAELIQGILLEEGIPSVERRSRGFDVPDFLAAGPRDILVPRARIRGRPRAARRHRRAGSSQPGAGATPPAAAARRDPDRAGDRRGAGLGAVAAGALTTARSAQANGSSSSSASDEPARGSSSRR